MASTTSRTEVNRLFQDMGEKFVTYHSDEIPGAERLLKGRGCLEQLGRMINKVDRAIILEQAKIAANALDSGSTVKQVEEYLRVGRNHNGEWFNPAFLHGQFMDFDIHTNILYDNLSNDDLKTLIEISNECVKRFDSSFDWFSKQSDGKPYMIYEIANREFHRSMAENAKKELRRRA